MKSDSMSDVPDDLSSVGAHRGPDPPTETSQTVRSPEGPDASTSTARPASALFQLVRDPEDNRYQIRVHSPRAQISESEDTTEEVGRYRTVESLRHALADASVAGWIGVFEDAEADGVLTDEVTANHPWIGRPRYTTITLFEEADAASTYAEAVAAQHE